MKKRVLSMILAMSIAAAAVIGGTGCGKQNGAEDGKTEKLVVAVLSSESSDGSSASVYDDLGAHIEEETGIPVEVYEVGSYEAGIEALRTGKADMNLFSSFSYYLADKRAELSPISTDASGSISALLSAR